MSPFRTALRFALPCCAALLVAASTPAFAQQSAAPLPPKLEPLPEIAPPPELAGDPDLEPQVTISRKDGETIEEARVQGRLLWIRVTPRHGRPYFLIPDGGGETFIRRDSFDTGLKVPLWVLFSF